MDHYDVTHLETNRRISSEYNGGALLVPGGESQIGWAKVGNLGPWVRKGPSQVHPSHPAESWWTQVTARVLFVAQVVAQDVALSVVGCPRASNYRMPSYGGCRRASRGHPSEERGAPLEAS